MADLWIALGIIVVLGGLSSGWLMWAMKRYYGQEKDKETTDDR